MLAKENDAHGFTAGETEAPMYYDLSIGSPDVTGRAPLRSKQTIAQYRTEGARLMRQARPEAGLDDVSRMRWTVGWFVRQAEVWSPATIRHHRAALRQLIADLVEVGMLDEIGATSLNSILKSGPDPRRTKKQPKAGAKKRKSITECELERLFRHLVSKKTQTAWILAGFVYFGARFGLRPKEWRDAVIVGDEVLRVKCGKHTNGRGLAEHREICFAGFSADEIQALHRFLMAFSKAAAAASTWQAYHERLAKSLHRACKELKIAPIALYTLRHSALATAKRFMTAAEVAALAGHASVRSAERSYAKKKTGWREPRAWVRPTQESLEAVRGFPTHFNQHVARA